MEEKKPYAKPTITSRAIEPKDIEAGARFAERRVTPRYTLIATAEIVEPISNMRLLGRTAEIGMGGCYVDILNTLPKGAVIELSIQRDGNTLKVWGRVVYAHENIGMGVQFFDVAPQQQVMLRQWIADLSSSDWAKL
jgi:hypothetical protein